MGIQENLASVRQRLGQAAQRRGVDASAVKILGVTKYVGEEEIRELLAAGLTCLGENRIQQAEQRLKLFPEAEWHFIGHLQTNKVRFCKDFALIHSLDRFRLAQALDNRAEQWGKSKRYWSKSTCPVRIVSTDWHRNRYGPLWRRYPSSAPIWTFAV